MTRKNSLTDFVEKQEILNNIQTSIKKLYADDEMIDNEKFLEELTLRTLDTINYMDRVYEGLLADPSLMGVAEQFDTSVDSIAKDIIEIMMFSTIARQNMIIEVLKEEV